MQAVIDKKKINKKKFFAPSLMSNFLVMRKQDFFLLWPQPLTIKRNMKNVIPKFSTPPAPRMAPRVQKLATWGK